MVSFDHSSTGFAYPKSGENRKASRTRTKKLYPVVRAHADHWSRARVKIYACFTIELYDVLFSAHLLEFKCSCVKGMFYIQPDIKAMITSYI